ncbi:MAG TPA: YegS/Rv2252/BmrU family lipid kinase, partial [Acidimicrobiia bacterium]
VSLSTLREVLGTTGIEYEMVAPSTRPEMIEAIVEASREGCTHFVMVGGDGTVNLAVNALMPLDLGEKPTIGILPAGTGCDLLRTFGISQNLGEAAKHLGSDSRYTIDVAYLDGSWGRRFFVNVAQAGVGAAAAESARRLVRSLGPTRYPLAFLARLPRFPRAAITITTEKRSIETEALAVIFANAQFFAGGWNVAPRATLIDGVLDLQIIDTAKRRAPALVPKVVKGTHLGDSAVRRFSVSEFDLKSEPAWPVEADGDHLGNTDISGRVIPAAINLKI